MSEAKADSLQLFLFTDEPLRELTDDHLSLRPFSSMVAAAALTNRGPFNIGVFSGWGQGKTTVLRQAQALINDTKKPNVITCWVNAWQYEHEAHPIVPLLAIIINEITKAIDARKTLTEKENVALAKSMGDLKRALRSIAYGFSAKAGAKIPGFANLEIGFVAKDMIERDEKLSSDRDPLLDQSLYYHAYERLETFREQLSKAKNTEDQPKIIVFIDDLDRCLPSKALHLLESLKLVLAQPGFIFVLGVDRKVIDAFLTKRYHEDFGIPKEQGHGQQYMDKIIQLPLDLPHHQNRFHKYIDNLIKGTKDLPDAFSQLFTNKEDGSAFTAALAAGCDRTPRTLIRTLNYLLTDLYLRENKFFELEKDPFANSAEFLQFAAVSRITRLTVGSEHEKAYRSFISNNAACEEAHNYFNPSTSKVAEYRAMLEKTMGHDNKTSLLESFSVWPALTKSDSLKELLESAIGLRWLTEHEKRQSIEGFLATREEPAPAADENSLQIINAAIRKKLDLPEGAIGDDDRKKITELNLSGTEVSDVSAFRSLTSLQRLYLNGTHVSDVSAIMNLPNLQTLSVSNTPVSDVSTLQSLTRLQRLSLNNTQVSDVSALRSLISLQWLDLDGTKVSDVSALKSLSSLQLLGLSGTQVSDVSALTSLKDSLKELWLGKTPISKDKNAMAALRAAMPNTEIKI